MRSSSSTSRQQVLISLKVEQDEEMRAFQRENGVAAQRTADLRERLNFQCFKYELLVDMVRTAPSHARICDHCNLVAAQDLLQCCRVVYRPDQFKVPWASLHAATHVGAKEIMPSRHTCYPED